MPQSTKPSTQSRRGRRGSKKDRPVRRFILKWTALACAWGLVAAIALLIVISFDLPSMEVLTSPKKPTVILLASDGSELTRYEDAYGEPVPFEALPAHLINAVTATEDRRFFSHFGIDLLGIARAMVVNIASGRVKQGGSTITQQLAKISFLTHDRTFKRKLQEAVLALQLERYFTKQEIMAMYLNRIYMGAGKYGMDSAAQYYFGKPITDIDIYEAAMLAGMIKAPSRYTPSKNLELSATRATQVLDNMDNAEVLPLRSVADLPYKVPTIVALNEEGSVKSKASYFGDWVMEQLPDYIGNIEHDVIIHTTLSSKMQLLAEQTIKAQLKRDGEKRQISQAALITLSSDGAVLAMVGGKDYTKSQFNRATQAKRQPGSAFKPFIYATAFEYGLTPDDMMVDEVVSFGDWSPQNYNKQFLGEMSLETAFAKSVNTVAVKLANDVGMESIIRTTRKLGIASDIEPNLSSALGSSEVSLLELTGAYAHFASNGKPLWVYAIDKIEAGEFTLYQREVSSQQSRVLKPETVASMNRIFRYTMQQGTGKNARINRDAGGKTGTSQGYRDAWFIGYTPDYVTGIWFGNDENEPMKAVTGGGAPARSWKSYMQAALQDIPPKTLPTNAEDVRRGKVSGDSYESFWERIFGSFGGENISDDSDKNGNSDEGDSPSWIEYDYPNSSR